MICLAGVRMLQQAAWRKEHIHDDVAAAFGISSQPTEPFFSSDAEAACMWVEGGVGDLDRNLSRLAQVLADAKGSRDVGSAKVEHALVYGTQPYTVKSSL